MSDTPQNEEPTATKPPEARPMRSAAPVVTGARVGALIPTDIDSAWRLATAFAASNMLPKSYYDDKNGGDPVARAFTAMQIGAEVGLAPITAIQSIAVVNGVATLWGDTQKALVLNSGKAEYIREGYDGGTDCFKRIAGDHNTKTPNLEFTAWCETKRGDEVTRISYSVQDAIDAGLWGKDIWLKHPKRMLRYKARAFCLRDVYPDVLKGLAHSAEEMEGEIIEITPNLSTRNITPHNPAAKLSGLLRTDSINPIQTPDEHRMIPTSHKAETPQVTTDEDADLPAFFARLPAPETSVKEADINSAASLLKTADQLLGILAKEPEADSRQLLFADNNGGQLLQLLRDKGLHGTADKFNLHIGGSDGR